MNFGDFGKSLASMLARCDDQLSLWLLIPLLVFSGIYFTIRTKFVQIRYFKDMFRSMFEKTDKGNVSSFKSMMISMASRVGVGHIAGIASAIIIGGPGAVFWMWAMAIFGGASAFIESTLAQIYKVKDGKNFRGGPSYYMEKALGKKWLGKIFAVLLIAAYAYGFNAMQSFQLSSAFERYIPHYHDSLLCPLIVGGIIAALVALVIFGGTHRIGFISEWLVPIKSILYILLSLFIVLKNFDKIPAVFQSIFTEAFNFKAIFGASFYGSALMMGIKRGLFSNEAGMGTAPNAAAAAHVAHPVNQGLVQVGSVLIDTLVICSATAFIVLLAGGEFLGKGLKEVPFIQEAVSSQVGPFGADLIAFSIFSFAITAIIGNYCYAESNILFLKNSKKSLLVFRITCLAAVFFGPFINGHTAWNIADIAMILMACVNLPVILLLGKKALVALNDYSRQKKQGKAPKFVAQDVGIENTEAWE